MMFVALVAFDDPLEPPDPPPRPGILSLTADAAPFSAPLTGLSPSAAAFPDPSAALRVEFPLAASSSRSVRPLSLSPIDPSALSLTVLNSSSEADFSRLPASVWLAKAAHLPDRERDAVFFAGAFLAVLFLAAVFFAGAFL